MHIPGVCVEPCLDLFRWSLCLTNVLNILNKNGPLNFSSFFSTGNRRNGEGPLGPVFHQSAAHSLSTKSSTLSSTCSLRAECANTALATELMHPPASARATFCRPESISLIQGSDRDGDEMDIWIIVARYCSCVHVLSIIKSGWHT